MKNPLSTIFSRMLTASVVSFALVMAFILLAVSNIVYKNSVKTVNQSTVFFADHAAEKITDTMQGITRLLELTNHNISDAIDGDDRSHNAIGETMRALMNAHPEIHCTWLELAPGVMNDKGEWYGRVFIRSGDEIHEAPSLVANDVMNPDVAPWHVVPFTTGKHYFKTFDHWDYGPAFGQAFIGTIGMPVSRRGKILGSVGLDILYQRAVRFMENWQIPEHRSVVLFTGDGQVLFSPDENHIGLNLPDLGFSAQDREKMFSAMERGEALLWETDSAFHKSRSLVSLTPITFAESNRKLYLYIDQPVGMLFAEMRTLLLSIFSVCVIGMLVLIAAAYLAARTIVGPLNRITAFADHIANDLPADPAMLESGAKGGQELALLARSIGLMMEKLQQNHDLKLYAVQADFAKQQLVEASRARTQFFASMSHEIRTPMNAILGISDILLAERMPVEQRRYIGDIKASCEALLVIIDDILDISKLESGKLKLIPAHFDLEQLLDNVSGVVRYLIRGQDIEFVSERLGNVPRHFYGDEGRLRQILLNLLSNAVKFTAKGSISLRVEEREPWLEFAISDSGIGIHEEDLRVLFQAYKQVDLQRNRKIKGSGLGLAISMNLARMMGGDILVESVYGEGTTFLLRIPLTPGRSELSGAEEELSESGWRKQARVLVVDDNAVNLQVGRGLMKIFGLECDTARSGFEALEMLREKEYDLVFMDHMMPEMDGIEATRHIRAMGGRFKSLPIIALTANAVGEDLYLRAGLSDYLAKPIQRRTLQRVLLAWLPEEKKRNTSALNES